MSEGAGAEATSSQTSGSAAAAAAAPAAAPAAASAEDRLAAGEAIDELLASNNDGHKRSNKRKYPEPGFSVDRSGPVGGRGSYTNAFKLKAAEFTRVRCADGNPVGNHGASKVLGVAKKRIIAWVKEEAKLKSLVEATPELSRAKSLHVGAAASTADVDQAMEDYVNEQRSKQKQRGCTNADIMNKLLEIKPDALGGLPAAATPKETEEFMAKFSNCGYSQRPGAGMRDDGFAMKAAAEPQQPEGPSLGFVGAGMMATAMINGIIASKVTKPENIMVSAAHQASLDKLAPTGVRTSQSNAEVAAGADVVILAVKPDILPSVLREIEPHLSDDALVMSIAAGIQLPVLEELVPGKRVVRVMPNTPCLVSEGACGFSMGTHATTDDTEVVHSLLGAVGYACEVKEPLLDALTGVSGSGPAYIFVLIEALADGGVRMGLPRNLAIKLAAQTVKGAAAMVLDTGEHPAVLKDQVCSPGGLTIAAIESLERDGFRAAAMRAVITVASKSIEMREGGKK